MKGERGFALVITLVITALLVALTAEFVNEVFVDASASRSFVDGQQASLLADSGVEAATKLMLFSLPQKKYTSLADMDQLTKLLHIEDETGTIQVTAEDESGKLNLNLAWGDNGVAITGYSDIAGRLVKNLGLSPDLLDSIADWRDTNDDPDHPGGAETPYYQTLKPPYVAKNGTLSTVEELRMVKGFDSATFNRLRPLVTVYKDCNNININTAPVEVIQALSDDMTASLASKVVEYRKSHPFENVNDLGNVPGMSQKIVQGLQLFYVSVKGTVFRIRSEARVNETIRVVEALVNSDGKILYWREY